MRALRPSAPLGLGARVPSDPKLQPHDMTAALLHGVSRGASRQAPSLAHVCTRQPTMLLQCLACQPKSEGLTASRRVVYMCDM